MRRLGSKVLFAAVIMAGSASASAFQFSVLSHGNFSVSTVQDNETVDFYYYNGIAAIPVTNLFLDGNTFTGVLSGPGNVDTMSFQFSIDNSQTFGSNVNQELQWQYTGGTGAFANLTGLGSISIDFHYVDQNNADTTSGMTGELEPVPEPASMAALGVGALALIRRRRKA